MTTSVLPVQQEDRMFVNTNEVERYISFMDDVKVISVKYNVWIVGPHAKHLWPIVYVGDCNEKGYRVQSEGHGYTFDRALPSQELTMPDAAMNEFRSFIAELTELSKKHRLWIRAGTPTTWPRIARNDSGKPGRYQLYPLVGGHGFQANSTIV